MRQYFTRRCIVLHLLLLILVPAFGLASWWQYEVARSGNDLSWVYTVEWPLFAVYAVYVWWKLIHDRSTPLDRLWARHQRAAAEASGMPIHQIPGWARDKELSQAVRAASTGAGRRVALSSHRRNALGSGDQEVAGGGAAPRPVPPEANQDHDVAIPSDHDPAVIEARILGVKVEVDEELEAYNQYLFELNWNGPPKRWKLPRRRPRDDPASHPEESS